MMIEYVRVREDVKPPERANPSDAGLDVFFCPMDASITGIQLKPGESKYYFYWASVRCPTRIYATSNESIWYCVQSDQSIFPCIPLSTRPKWHSWNADWADYP